MTSLATCGLSRLLAQPLAPAGDDATRRAERVLLQVMAELVVGEAKGFGGAALVEVMGGQRLGEEALLEAAMRSRKSRGR